MSNNENEILEQETAIEIDGEKEENQEDAQENDDAEINTAEDDFDESDVSEPEEKDEDDEIPEAEKLNGQEEAKEETESPIKEKRDIPWKKILMASGCAVAVIGIIYLVGVAYYTNHFLFNTEIGNFNCSNMNVEEVKNTISDQIENYQFVLHEKNDVQEVITGEEIEMSHSIQENFEELLGQQNPYIWMFDWTKKKLPIEMEVNLNEEKLRNRINELDVVKASYQAMDGSAAGVYYENGTYHVHDDGTKDIVSVNKLFEQVKNNIIDLYNGTVLEDSGCYVGIEGEDSMRAALDMLNKFVSSKITYKKGENECDVLTGETIQNWAVIKEDYSVSLDKTKIREYVNKVATKYETVGKDRKFKTTGGSEVTISGGDYGWLVDSAKETDALAELIQNGAQEEREPIYKRQAAVHGDNNDISNTYVEVSISQQHLWFYKDGSLIISTDVVTGNPLRGNGTHTGVYSLKYKDRNAVLKGEGYETPVSYWMPFNGGEGLHDANWRGSFGGSIYRGNGSHGCVNMPPSQAAKLYESVAPGTPVIIY